MKSIYRIVLVSIVSSSASGQTAPVRPAFEVVSVKATPQPATFSGRRVGCFGGPGSSDPGRYVCDNATIALMALQAYNLKPFQFKPEDFQEKAIFSVVAKVPPGATKQDLNEMMQNLLADRFKLTFHFEKKERAVFHLVPAPGGARLTEAAPAAAAGGKPPADGPKRGSPVARDAEGFTIYPAEPHSFYRATANGKVRLTSYSSPLSALVSNLTNQLQQPVIDFTGLKGSYDFTLTYVPDPSASSPSKPTDPGSQPLAPDGMDIFSALEKQLGLRLEKAKDVIDMFVIDRADRNPTEN